MQLGTIEKIALIFTVAIGSKESRNLPPFV